MLVGYTYEVNEKAAGLQTEKNKMKLNITSPSSHLFCLGHGSYSDGSVGSVPGKLRAKEPPDAIRRFISKAMSSLRTDGSISN